MLNIINKQIAVTSNVCRPKCNVNQQNTKNRTLDTSKPQTGKTTKRRAKTPSYHPY